MANINKKIHPHYFLGLIGCLSTALLITIIFSWIFYADPPYAYWELTISQLGGIWIWDGNIQVLSNPTSQLIFTVGLSFCSVICFILTILAFIEFRRGNQAFLNTFLFGIMCIGAALIAFPRDHETVPILHYVGVVLFIIGFGLFNAFAQLYRRGRKRLDEDYVSKLDFMVVWLVIGVCCVYGISFIINRILGTPDTILNIINALSQKLVVGLCVFAIWLLDEDDIGFQSISNQKDPEKEKYLTKQIFLNGIYKKFK